MKALFIPFGIAGASVGMGLAGDAFNSTGLQEGGAAAGKFVAPAVNIHGAGMVMGMLQNFPRSEVSLHGRY